MAINRWTVPINESGIIHVWVDGDGFIQVGDAIETGDGDTSDLPGMEADEAEAVANAMLAAVKASREGAGKEKA